MNGGILVSFGKVSPITLKSPRVICAPGMIFFWKSLLDRRGLILNWGNLGLDILYLESSVLREEKGHRAIYIRTKNTTQIGGRITRPYPKATGIGGEFIPN